MSQFKKNIYKYRELLNYAYLSAMACPNGMSIEKPSIDVHSTDVYINTFHEKGESFLVKAQLKSTENLVFDANGFASFTINSKNHNELCQNYYHTTVLFVYKVHSDSSEWVKHTNDELQIRHSVYYYDYSTEKKIDTKSKTLKISNKNLVTPNNFNKKMIELYNKWYEMIKVVENDEQL